MDSVDEIKQKLDIVNIVGEYVELKRTGINYKGRCPFHNEKTPSFFVNPDRQRFHCFGCNEGGDIFTFLQKMDGLEFAEALKILARKAGVELKSFDSRAVSRKNRLLSVCENACNFWQEKLNSTSGEKARNYIEKRKLNLNSLTQFKIGYAPESWDETMSFLKTKGFTEVEIFEAGLTVKKEKGSGYYDRFRDRLIFPIQDLHGNVIGFTGRALKDQETAKYINTPESEIYHKSRVLYGLDKAKNIIRQIKYAVVVEGNMDVITAHEFNYKNVVACSGTALTMEQIQLLKRYTSNIALCLDSDEAGQRATQRSIDLLFEAEMNVKIIELEIGKDPDECLRKDKKAWENSIKNAKLVMQFYLDRNFTPENLNDINKKKIAVKNVMNELAKIKNKIEQDFWIKKIANRLNVNERLLWESLPNQKIIEKPKIEEKKAVVRETKSKDIEYFEIILSIILNKFKLINYVGENIHPDMVVDNQLSEFYNKILLYYNENESNNQENFKDWLKSQDFNVSQDYLNSLILIVDKLYEDFSDESMKIELIDLVKVFKKHYIEKKSQDLNKQLKQAEDVNDIENRNKILQQIIENNNKLQELIKE